MTPIILIYPPIYYKKNIPQSLDVTHPPLGILYLAGILEKNNIPVKVIDIGSEKQTINQTLQIIKKEKPILIGISAMTPLLQGAVTIAKKIKKTNKNIKICLGGPHISADPDFINRIKYFDFGITGEGEYSFLEIYQKIINHQKIPKITIGKTPKNLSRLPWPAIHLVNHSLYHKTASMIATRGCPYNCYYCSRPCISNLVRYRDPQDVVNEMNARYYLCDGNYLFQDDALTINRDFIIQLCQKLIKQPLKYHWAGNTRIDLVDPKLLKLMHQAGCYCLVFGIESGDEKIRNEIILKHFSNKKIIETIKLCNKYKIEANGFFMFGHPTETPQNLLNTIDFTVKNDFKMIGVSIATPFPGSKLWQYALKDKIVDQNFIDKFALGQLGAGYSGVYPVYIPSTLDRDWVYQQRKIIFRKFYLRPKYIFNRFKKDFTSFKRLKEDFFEGLSVLIKGSSSRAPYKKKIQ